jgi:hypothetical protein
MKLNESIITLLHVQKEVFVLASSYTRKPNRKASHVSDTVLYVIANFLRREGAFKRKHKSEMGWNQSRQRVESHPQGVERLRIR